MHLFAVFVMSGLATFLVWLAVCWVIGLARA